MSVKLKYFRNLMRIICVSVCVFCVFIGSAISSNNLPSGYTELEYIKSTGTQWINTAIVPTLDYTVEVKAIKNAGTSIFGSGSGDYTFTGLSGGNYAYIGYYGNGSGKAQFYVTCDNQEQPHIWKISNRTAYCDDNASSVSSYTTQPTLPLALFARTTSATTVNDMGAHTMYYAKIYNEFGTLVGNFIPARRNNDNVVGMYDMITNTFFSTDTGSFIAGPVLEIRIATTKYVETAFADSVSDLNTAIGTVKTVVDNTIIQADRVGKLATGKQTRPTGSCPKGRMCLLITEADGTLRWYPICGGDGSVEPFDSAAFLTSLTTAGNPVFKVTLDSNNWTYYNGFFKGLSTWRKQYVDGSINTEDRPFAHTTRCTSPYYNSHARNASPCYTETGMYKTLTDGEWAVVYEGDEKASSASTPVDPGVIYGISKCVSANLTGTVSFQSKATTTQLADPLFSGIPTNQTDGADYKQCWCKMTAIGLPGGGTTTDEKAANGGIVNLSNSSWVFYYLYDSAATCASNCTFNCTFYIWNNGVSSILTENNQ